MLMTRKDDKIRRHRQHTGGSGNHKEELDTAKDWSNRKALQCNSGDHALRHQQREFLLKAKSE